MMGIPIDGHAHVCNDNMSVIANSTRPKSTLKKKSNVIAYHFVHKNVANGTCKIAHDPSETNLADLLAKIQSGTERTQLATVMLY